jgi:hypothetical protein
MNFEMIQLFRDGDQMCALMGANLQEGYAGFGNTAGEALRELAKALDDNNITVF